MTYSAASMLFNLSYWSIMISSACLSLIHQLTWFDWKLKFRTSNGSRWINLFYFFRQWQLRCANKSYLEMLICTIELVAGQPKTDLSHARCQEWMMFRSKHFLLALNVVLTPVVGCATRWLSISDAATSENHLRRRRMRAYNYVDCK